MTFARSKRQGATEDRPVAAQFIPDMLADGGAKSRTSGKHWVSAPSNSCAGTMIYHHFFVRFFSRYKFLWQEVESAMATDDNTITEQITILQYRWPSDRTNISRPPIFLFSFFFCNQQPALKDFFLWLWIHQWSYHNSIKHPNRQELQARLFPGLMWENYCLWG